MTLTIQEPFSTNDHKPFEPGELIGFCGDHFVVVENFGDTGSVHEVGDENAVVRFHWNFLGERCYRLQEG